MSDPYPQLTDLLPDGRIIVICGRADDAQAWQDLFGPSRCLAIPLDTAPRQERERPLRGACDHLAWQHHAIAGLDGSGWLGRTADAFDPDGTATLVLPDPLDPPYAGSRHRIGRRHPSWRLFEDKTIVDALWDTLGVPRAPSIVTDAPTNLGVLGKLVDQGTGVVCSYQPTGAGPMAGGDGIWWWRDSQPPPTIPAAKPGVGRFRLMPLLEGIPVRLHGLVLSHAVVPFPPMELVTLSRMDRGTFLCAGAVPTLGHAPDLVAQTERIGSALRERLGYRGGFSVDGILTTDGFLPTDFNARLTSAMEAAPPNLRVRLHAANLLARSGTDTDRATVGRLSAEIFTNTETYTLYGAATRVREGAPRHTPIRWDSHRLVPSTDEHADGHLTLAPSPRGWLLTAAVTVSRLPTTGRLGALSSEIFRLSDSAFGTDFGELNHPLNSSAGVELPKWRAVNFSV